MRRTRVDSAGSTVRNSSPHRVDVPPEILAKNTLKRSRSRSPHLDPAGSPSLRGDSHNTELGDSWWGNRELLARPWHQPPKRKRTIPSEQSERWEITRKVCVIYVCESTIPSICLLQRVGTAAVSVLGTGGDVIHELLEIGVDFFEFAPIPGLKPAARALLQIWDTLQQVDVNIPTFRIPRPLTQDPTDKPFSVSSPHRTLCGHPTFHS